MNEANHLAHLFSKLGKYCALAIVIAFTQCAIAQDTETVKDTVKEMERDAETAKNNPLVEADKGTVTQVPVRPSASITSRPPLLREGSFLTEVACILERDPDVGFWIIRLVENSERVQSMPDKFVVLPCSKLNQMQRTIESTNMDIVFQVTGRILVYEEINYLLPLSAPLLERYNETQEEPADAAGGNEDGEESAEDLINRVKREVQLPKSLPIGAADKPQGKDKDEVATLLPEGTLLLSRRGQVKRTANGGWQFVFSSDSSGLEDPPMAMLPCLLLEKMQDDVQYQTNIKSILITGQVYNYKERNYLIPTMYRIEREQKNIR